MIVAYAVTDDYVDKVGWTCFLLFVAGLVALRAQVRDAFNIYGSVLEDLMCALVLYPVTIAQMEFQVKDQITGMGIIAEDQVPAFLLAAPAAVPLSMPSKMIDAE